MSILLPKHDTYKVRADQDDLRDFLYVPVRSPLRDQVDMRQWASPVEDQRHLGSCTGNAVVGAYELLMNKQSPQQFIDLSRLFVYYNARLIEGNVENDEGAYIRDGIKSVVEYGVCTEKIWPYNIEMFSITPTVSSYDDAKTRNIKNYFRIINLDCTLDAMNNDKPVVIGMRVYPEFDELTSNDPVLKMPKPNAEPIGGHAMCLVGYDMSRQQVLARNSFGPNWCINGYCWIPFEYVKQEFMDSWVFDITLSN